MHLSVLRPACVPVLVAAAISIAAPAGASATTVTAAGIMSTFNVVTATSLTTTSDVEGSAVIGTSLSGGTFFNNDVPANPVVDLYGTQSGGTTLDTGALYYQQIAGSVQLNGAATKQQGNWPNALTDFLNPLNLLSQQLSTQLQQAGNTITVANNNITFNATSATSNGIAYFDLTAAQFTAYFNEQNNPVSNYKYTFGSGVTSIVVNVDGTPTLPQINQNTIEQNVLLNFYDATSVSLYSWETAVLAPDAAATLPGSPFDGFIYAQSISTGAEIHNYAYTGNLPPPPSGVPEPASLTLAAAGLATLGVIRRPRRTAATSR